MDHSQLKRLPPELRLIIWELVVGEPLIVDVHTGMRWLELVRMSYILRSSENCEKEHAISLARTCREIYNEVLPIILSTHAFEVDFHCDKLADDEDEGITTFNNALCHLRLWIRTLGSRKRHLKRLAIRAADQSTFRLCPPFVEEYNAWLYEIKVGGPSFSKGKRTPVLYREQIALLQAESGVPLYLVGGLESYDSGCLYWLDFDLSSYVKLNAACDLNFVPNPADGAEDPESREQRNRMRAIALTKTILSQMCSDWTDDKPAQSR